MASSIFGQPQGNTILGAVNQLKAMANGNPQALYDSMYQNDPRFRQFADSMQGKTPEQAFQEMGYDFDLAQSFLR